MMQLKPMPRAALVLRHVYGYDYQQIAAMMTGKTQADYAQMMLDGGRPVMGNRSKAEWKNRG